MEPRSATLAVLDAVASRKDCSPKALPPLYDVVDPDALDRLFTERSPGTGSAEFWFAGYQVNVFSTGEVIVREEPSVEKVEERASA